MDKKRNIYKFVCVIDNVSSIVLESGSLRDIDDFILQNNINSADDLISFIDMDYVDDISQLRFSIIYKKDGEVREKSILYKDDILSLRKNKIQIIIDKLKNDEELRNNFYDKYIRGYLNGIAIRYANKSSYVTPDNIKEISKIIDKLITKKIQHTKEELEMLPPSERYEIETGRLTRTTTDYNKLRSMYTFVFDIPKSNIVTTKRGNKLSGNEFEELMMHDQSPDDRIRYPEDYIIEDNNEMNNNKVMSKKHKIKQNPFKNQISIFDNE